MTTYRINPRHQPTLPRKTPWWRLALWWARGGPRRLEAARMRRDPYSEIDMRVERLRAMIVDLSAQFDSSAAHGNAMRLYDSDGTTAVADYDAVRDVYTFRQGGDVRTVTGIHVAARSWSPGGDCPVCCAVAGEPCCPNEHRLSRSKG